MKHFQPSEFACKCGCGSSNMDPGILEKLDYARGLAGTAFIINSANRCSAHNAKVGGTGNSSHLHGYAVDIRIRSSIDRWDILNALLTAGFTRLGIYPTFIHADVDLNKPQQCMWVGK